METEKGNSLWLDAWMRLKKNKMAIISLWIFLIMAAICFILPMIDAITKTNILPDPTSQDLPNSFAPPSKEHWLGKDASGRDLLSRVIYGGRVSLLCGIIAAFVATFIGIIYGAVSGYIGGKLDSFLMRIVDILYSLPYLIVVILFFRLLSGLLTEPKKYLIKELKWSEVTANILINIIPLCVVIGALGWFTMARALRTQALATKKLEYIEAARSLGLSHSRILFRHILPNLLGTIIVYSTLTIPGFILTESTLSFLGIGVEAPFSSWGSMLTEGSKSLETQPRVLIIPAIAFSITLFSLNFLGDGLRDALDPKSSKD